HNIGEVLMRAIVVNGDDVRVFQTGGGFRLTGEAFKIFRSACHHRRQNLDRDLALEVDLKGTVNRSHAPRTQKFSEFILTDALSSQVLTLHWYTRNRHPRTVKIAYFEIKRASSIGSYGHIDRI